MSKVHRYIIRAIVHNVDTQLETSMVQLRNQLTQLREKLSNETLKYKNIH